MWCYVRNEAGLFVIRNVPFLFLLETGHSHKYNDTQYSVKHIIIEENENTANNTWTIDTNWKVGRPNHFYIFLMSMFVLMSFIKTEIFADFFNIHFCSQMYFA